LEEKADSAVRHKGRTSMPGVLGRLRGKKGIRAAPRRGFGLFGRILASQPSQLVAMLR
jgi:hypothetical protein